VGGGSREPRTAIEVSFSAWGGLEKLDPGRDRGETFFPDSGSDRGSGRGSDRDSNETFQISRNLGLELIEFVCLLDSQLCFSPSKSLRPLTQGWPTFAQNSAKISSTSFSEITSKFEKLHLFSEVFSGKAIRSKSAPTMESTNRILVVNIYM
jgi:hypothetical protein